jgi:heat shock protein 4
LECRNEMEAYIFEMRGSANRKHSELIADKEALRVICDEYENWLWDNGELVSLQDITDKFESLKNKLEGPEVEVSLQSHEGEVATSTTVKRRAGGLCSEYLALLEKDKRDVEEMLMKEAAEAALEEKDEDEDHDFRKLRKPERMRMVVKNKDEGTELFKDGNIRPAAARYQKALSHAAKFFDLSPEDTEEVNAVKLSIYLNLTQCYLKLGNNDDDVFIYVQVAILFRLS